MKSPIFQCLFFTALFTFLILDISAVFADTVILTDDKEIKGLIVDEYVDRLVISTFEGEKTFSRKDIGSVQYEDTQTRLLKLGDDAVARGKYKTAIYYYREVLKLNPDFTEARDGEITAVRKELGSGAEIAKEEIDLMIALGEAPSAGAATDKRAAYEKSIRELLGIMLKKDEKAGIYRVKEVLPGSVSASHGIYKDDIISAVWNENVGYMDYDGIINKLSGPEFSMLKLSIERKATFPAPKKIKLDTGLKEEGYFIKEISGIGGKEAGLIKPGDWLVEVNSISTRYLPKDELNNLLANKKPPLTLLIRRDLYMTREKRR